MARFDRRLMSQALTNIVKNATEAVAAAPPTRPNRAEDRDHRSRATATTWSIDVDRQRHRPAAGEPRAPARALRHHPREGHRPRPRHRRQDHGGARRRHRAGRRPGGRQRRARRLGAPEVPRSIRRRRPPQPASSRLSEAEVNTWPSDILIVDDEADIRELVAGILEDEGYDARTAGDSDEALAAIEQRRPHLVLPRHLAAGQPARRPAGARHHQGRTHPDLPVVMISGHGNIETAVTAIKRGAYDFIEKPFKADRLVLVVERALGGLAAQARGEGAARPRAGRAERWSASRRPSTSCATAIERVAPTNSRVLIGGPSGSGKELAARMIHAPVGPRQRAVRRHQRGGDDARAHGGGAVRRRGRRRRGRKVGALEEAHGGTLYSTRSPTCRARRRARSCACWSSRTSSGSAAPPACRSTCASSPRPAATCEAEIAAGPLPRGPLSTASTWCRSACRRWPSGARTSRS